MAFRGSLVRAFRRTGIQAERNDIHPALKKVSDRHGDLSVFWFVFTTVD